VHGESVELKLQDLWIKDVSITTGSGQRHHHAHAAQAGEPGQAEAGEFVTHRFKLDQMMEAYDVFGRAAETKAMKVPSPADVDGAGRRRVGTGGGAAPVSTRVDISSCPGTLRRASLTLPLLTTHTSGETVTKRMWHPRSGVTRLFRSLVDVIAVTAAGALPAAAALPAFLCPSPGEGT
jgi:hypothetical protein